MAKAGRALLLEVTIPANHYRTKRDIVATSGCCPATLGFPWAFYFFGFFKDADSNVAPPPYLGTAVGASDQAVICRMVWDDEFIAAALRASEGSVRQARAVHSG